MMDDEEFESRVSEIVKNVLDHPIDIPMGFRSWVTRFVETSDIRIPRSSVTALYTVGEHVRELGRPVHGRTCMIRVGQSPNYDYVQMTFDEVSNRWVSTQTMSTVQIEQYLPNTSNYIDLNITGLNWDQAPVTITMLKQKIDAGLKPQVHVAGKLMAHPSAGSVYVRAVLKEFDAGDFSMSNTPVATGGEISTNNTSGKFMSSGWVDMTVSGASKTYALLILQARSDNATTGNPQNHLSVSLRWVADPV